MTDRPACCVSANGRPGLLRRSSRIGACALPAAVLALLPKCPVCLAAHLTLWTGLGVSVTAAGYFRTALILLSVGTFIILATNGARKILQTQFPADTSPKPSRELPQ